MRAGDLGYDQPVKAAILAVGSELLGPDRLDTNSLKLTAVLEAHGVALESKSVVGDEEEEIARQLEHLVSTNDLVLVTGGLGPTSDDVTREAVARLVGRPLVRDPALIESLERRYGDFGLPMPATNRKQADVIQGARVLPNPRGTAPGMLVTAGGASLFLFPGVPRELVGMIEEELEPWLVHNAGDGGAPEGRVERRVVKVACLPESRVEELIFPAYEEFGRDSITVLAQPGEISLHLKATGSAARRRERLTAMTARMRELVGEAAFADDEETTLEGVVGRLLSASGQTLSVAESCTAGGVAARLTDVAGSSAYFLGGAVVYSNELKTHLLGVDPGLLQRDGAVSESVARSMAEGARERFGSDYALAITGVAGPGGGSDAKPVGTVHLALAGPGGVSHRHARFPGQRQQVRRLAAQFSLDLLRRLLLADQNSAATQVGPNRGPSP